MNVKYRLESIVETEYKYNCDCIEETVKPEDVSIQIGHSINPVMDNNRIIVSVKANVVSKKSDVLLVTNTVVSSFEIIPIKEVISYDKDGNAATGNAMLLDTFIVTAVGALRGVLMKNLKGTPLDFVVIPLIPIEDFRTKQ